MIGSCSVQKRAGIHVVLITGSPVCRNPRLRKEADALVRNGFRLTVVGPTFASDEAAMDAAFERAGEWKHVQAVDLTRASIQALVHRAVRRVGAGTVERTGLGVHHSLGYGLRATLRIARRLRADLYIGHQEVGLWVANQLARDGFRVAADLEDWYSEDLPIEARARRPIGLLREMEAAALRRFAYASTTSHAMARRLSLEYGAPEPAVIYNAFPWSDRRRRDGRLKDRVDTSSVSLHWVSQTIGPGRGIEILFRALSHIPFHFEVHLRGACRRDEKMRLAELFPAAAGRRLFFHDPVSPTELLSRISEHDIGLALEEPVSASRNLTVTNKMLHYLLGGLGVIATDTAGQCEVAAAAGKSVLLCRARDEVDLARAIEEAAGCRDRLATCKASAVEAARTRFCWECQEPVLLSCVERALAGEAAAA